MFSSVRKVKLKLLLISGVSSVCRVTGPPVNIGLFAAPAGSRGTLSTFTRTSSFPALLLQRGSRFEPF